MKKFLVFILIILIIILGGLLGYKYLPSIGNNDETVDTATNDAGTNNVVATEPEPEPVKEVQTFKGNDRPIAVMIDNHDDARPQTSLNQAYIVYEIIVEGGYTRLMPIYKGVDISKIGPVRSARPYFIDYALENDAIYVHFGWSPQAKSDISTYKVDDINGIFYSSSDFSRDSGKYAPHDVVTSTSKILALAKKLKYTTTSDDTGVLQYSTDEITLDDGIAADKEISIPFSTLENVTWKYDSDKKIYVKYANGKKQTDWITKEDITTKNIIITYASNYTLPNGGKDRQGLNNVGKLDGYYITDGKAIKITCEKKSRTAKTIYKDLNGNEITVNDGNTYVGICENKITIKGTTPATTTTDTNTVNNVVQ